ncbi:MAG: hypothetical protein ACI3VA_01285 [Candidatus Limivicinus sp.]|nr:hypothetical protein [Clostridiales bacterium]MDY4488312.1 hypothetical protein [Candidatus Limivicinus sp.]MDY6133381.1 hypothetical protein [Candidatus Limivicinus sp.]
MKKFWKVLFKILGKTLLVALIAFVATFALYMFNGENKLIYYVIRPFLNKHYDSQVRDRKI